MRPADGTVHTMRGVGRVLRDERGRALRMVGVNWDETEEKLVQQQLLAAKEAAEAADRAKSEFLAMMSHEIRTPMNAVVGFTSLLRRTSLGTEQREFVELIEASCETLLALINDILDFSRIESGRLEFEPEAVSPRAIVREVVEQFRPRTREKQLDLAVALDDDVPARIVSDPFRVRQVLFNLIGNATKFTEEGGITVHVARDLEPGGIVVTVLDTGIGIGRSSSPACSARSPRATPRPRGASAAAGWGSRSASAWSTRSAAGSRSRAGRAKGPRSGSSCRR